eukprot:767309-Hanusia_phi.AAC.7
MSESKTATINAHHHQEPNHFVVPAMNRVVHGRSPSVVYPLNNLLLPSNGHKSATTRPPPSLLHKPCNELLR